MTLNGDETERLRAAFVATARGDAPRADCPTPEDIWAAVRNELPPGELRRVLAHVAVCPVCTEAWRLAEALDSDATAEGSSRHLGGPQGWRKAAGVLAAAAVVLMVGLVVRQQWQSPEPVTRAARASTLALQIGSEPLPRANCVLRWTGFEGARYDVIVSRENLDILSKAVNLNRPEYLVPEEHLGGGPPVEPLLVYIEVHRPGEGTVASGTFSFKVR